MKQDLEREISARLEAHLFKAASGSPEHTPVNLAEAIRYSLLSPGKRIRPRLVLACAEMLSLPEEAALPVAIALEMIHCFTLIHDDLPSMDNDDFRRGRPSNHKVHGEAIALLAGDALMALAYDSFLDAAPHLPPENLVAALRRFTWACGPRGVIGGQAAEALLGSESVLRDLQSMHALKTGALFQASILIPKDMAGIDPLSLKGQVLDHFSAELGLAFQIVDDLEDFTQDQKNDSSLIPATSVLRYLSEEEARSATWTSLNQVTGDLLRVWGTDSEPLADIASEVIQKLEKEPV